MYPLQLLTGNVPLATMLATTLQPTTAGRELPSTASPLTVSRMPAPPTGTKWWHCSSDQEAMMLRPDKEEVTRLDITPEEHPHQRWKEGRPLSDYSRRTAGKPSGKIQTSTKLLGKHISKYTAPTMTMRVP